MTNLSGETILINNQKVILIPLGYCACGCGAATNIVTKTSKRQNIKKGDFRLYVHGHHVRGNYRNKNNGWKGGISKNSMGHKLIYDPNHHKSQSNGYVAEHILIAEKALGKPLPKKAIVHHHTEKELVICENQGYHMFLHRRRRAYEACGHANWLKCPFCKQYSPPEDFYICSTKKCHRKCKNKYEKKRKLSKKS